MGTELTTTAAPKINTAVSAAMQSKAAQEVTAAIIAAKNFPRDENEALRRIELACSRPRLAEAAVYEYAKGGQKVKGPSIRLAEALAQAWGNMQCGVTEVERKHGESVMLAYAVDLETNFRVEKLFSVGHAIDTRSGKKTVSDERGIYELTANLGARRLRACILSVIPGDVQDLAMERCERTLTVGDTPLAERIEKMVKAFAGMGVTKEDIERLTQCNVDALSASQLAKLQRTWTSIKDGVTTAQEAFSIGSDQPAGKSSGKSPKTIDDLKGNSESAAKETAKPANQLDADLEDLKSRAAKAKSRDELSELESLFIERWGDESWEPSVKAVIDSFWNQLEE